MNLRLTHIHKHTHTQRHINTCIYIYTMHTQKNRNEMKIGTKNVCLQTPHSIVEIFPCYFQDRSNGLCWEPSTLPGLPS